MPAMISIPLDEFDGLRTQVQKLQEVATAAKAAAEATKLEDPADRVRPMVEAMAAATAIIRFAVSNLDPETIRRWPYKELRVFAKALALTPTVEDRAAIASEFEIFSNDCESWERYRIEE